ncbi:MAG TPA: hypothetical protein VG388_05225 [Solirubrobacteraceae bacterium]|nr:hypothetical protein [Solirubrobacteraceae bacterium]
MVASVIAGLALIPAPAQAHGPTAPVGINYRAVLDSAPAGVVATVVDGDQSMWLQVSPAVTLAVLDYQGGPYLRFTAAGVYVNTRSEMYYLNQPTQVPVPLHIGPESRPVWVRASSGHSYSWHDGRLQALATVKLAPGASFAGNWRIPLLVDGRSAALSGGLWYRPPPSPVWFWPIAVILACALALRRVSRPALSRGLIRALSVAAVLSLGVAAVALELHGRPNVSLFQHITLGMGLAVAVLALARILLARAGLPLFFVIGAGALGAGFDLLPALLNGFVLVALPAFLARADAVLCLGCGLSLFVLVLWELWDRMAPITAAPAAGNARPANRAGLRSG